jgi:hypothetical protein
MSDRPTPETDTLESRLSAFNFYDRYYKTLTLARRLERERDEARDALSGRTVSCWQCDQVAAERDEARTLARELRDAIVSARRFVDCYESESAAAIDDKWATARKCNAVIAKAKEVMP